MATENFLTYPEVDAGSKITVTSSRVSFTNLARTEESYVYSDKGANYFNGNFVHLFTLCVTAHTAGAEVAMPWVMANDIDDVRGIDYDLAGSDLYVEVARGSSPDTTTLNIAECDSGTPYGGSTPYTITLGTVYYLKVVRDEAVGTYGTLYLYIYSNAVRTTLLATLSVALHTSKKDFRYIYPLSVWKGGSAYYITGYTEDLTIEGGEANVLPEVTQQAPTSITATTCTGNGRINSLGLSAVTAHGHCWATTVNPTTANSKVDNGAGALGAFTSAITGLTPGTRYYIRAYATNSYGTAYSEGYSFIAGSGFSVMKVGNFAIVQTRAHYVGDDGKEYWLQGTAV